jgi:glycosyltransferase involved in cell wall biosynthesis
MAATVRVCALVPYAVGRVPSQRYRLEQWRPWLLRRGIALDFVPFADERLMALLYAEGRVPAKMAGLLAAFARRARDIVAARGYDAYIVHRTAALFGPALLEYVVKRRGPLIYDFDDAIFLLHTTKANRLFGWLKFPGKSARICRLSDHVVVGNDYLAEYARKHNPHVTVVPTSIDLDLYRPLPRRAPGQPVVIGWTGSSTSQTYLELFAPMLRELAARRPIEVCVISDRRPQLPGVPHRWEEWRAETEARALAQFDVGIMPMPDDIWSKGKCAAKALQCMAMGVPTVATAIGANCEVIADGVNGFLATTDDEWISALVRLVDDPGLRARLGDEGRRTVEQRYSAERSAELMARVILDAAGHGI